MKKKTLFYTSEVMNKTLTPNIKVTFVKTKSLVHI